MEFKTFGVIGYGNFGQFLARSLATYGDVIATDTDTRKLSSMKDRRIRFGSVTDVAQSDVVILAVPFSSLDAALDQIRTIVKPRSVVMDVLSTKSASTALLVNALADHPNILATHPLFGPPSFQRIHKGSRIVITYEAGARTANFVQFLTEDLRLTVERMSSEQHDQAMAYMQSLPFFIARALVHLDIMEFGHQDSLAIPSFQKLLTIANIEQFHTHDMFETSQLSNPYAEQARNRFIEALLQIQRQLEGVGDEAIEV